MAKFVVIGSNSFSGGDFVDFLLENPENEVIGISRSQEKRPLYLRYKRRPSPRFRFHQLDINGDLVKILDLLDRERPAFVINFAALLEPAYSWNSPEQWFYTNAIAVVRIANHLKSRTYLRKYLHISTPEVYGACPAPVREDAPVNPNTPYAASKAAADMYLTALARNYGFPVAIIRSSNVYGAHQQLYRIIPRSVIYLKQGRRIDMHGGGYALRSFVHIRDVSRGELSALEKGKAGSIYHFSSGTLLPVREIVRIVCGKMGKEFESSILEVPDRRGQDRVYAIDPSRSNQELGWTPRIGLSEGIEEVRSWIEQNWSVVEKEPLEYQHQFSAVPAYNPDFSGIPARYLPEHLPQ